MAVLAVSVCCCVQYSLAGKSCKATSPNLQRACGSLLRRSARAQALRSVTEVRWQRQLYADSSCAPGSAGSETSTTALTGGGSKLGAGAYVRAQLQRNAARAAFTGRPPLLVTFPALPPLPTFNPDHKPTLIPVQHRGPYAGGVDAPGLQVLYFVAWWQGLKLRSRLFT